MQPIVTRSADSLADRIVARLRELAWQGRHVVPARELREYLGAPAHFHVALRGLREQGQVKTRRVTVPNSAGRRRKMVALAEHAHHLPAGGGGRRPRAGAR